MYYDPVSNPTPHSTPARPYREKTTRLSPAQPSPAPHHLTSSSEHCVSQTQKVYRRDSNHTSRPSEFQLWREDVLRSTAPVNRRCHTCEQEA